MLNNFRQSLSPFPNQSLSSYLFHPLPIIPYISVYSRSSSCNKIQHFSRNTSRSRFLSTVPQFPLESPTIITFRDIIFRAHHESESLITNRNQSARCPFGLSLPPGGNSPHPPSSSFSLFLLRPSVFRLLLLFPHPYIHPSIHPSIHPADSQHFSSSLFRHSFLLLLLLLLPLFSFHARSTRPLGISPPAAGDNDSREGGRVMRDRVLCVRLHLKAGTH